MADIFIPETIRVGFQHRDKTFTDKLGFVIYYKNGKLCQEKSWNGWVDHKITPQEFDNKPTSGFMIARGIKRHGYNWGGTTVRARIYDPRGYEFEISMDTLVGLLMYTETSKGEIQGECVYGWKGGELILIPTNAEVYKEYVESGNKKPVKVNRNFTLKGLEIGNVYETNYHPLTNKYSWTGYSFTYIGEHIFFDEPVISSEKTNITISVNQAKAHVFTCDEKYYALTDKQTASMRNIVSRDKLKTTEKKAGQEQLDKLIERFNELNHENMSVAKQTAELTKNHFDGIRERRYQDGIHYHGVVQVFLMKDREPFALYVFSADKPNTIHMSLVRCEIAGENPVQIRQTDNVMERQFSDPMDILNYLINNGYRVWNAQLAQKHKQPTIIPFFGANYKRLIGS